MAQGIVINSAHRVIGVWIAAILVSAAAVQPRRAAPVSAPLSILARKGAEFGSVESPYQLVEILRAKGRAAKIKQFATPHGPALQSRAPSAGLDLMFVQRGFCDPVPPPASSKK